MSSFFAMGGHAAYIWPAYAVAGLVLGGIAVVGVAVAINIADWIADIEVTINIADAIANIQVPVNVTD